ncbi:MAG: type ISP restriction/modification enzyme [Cyanobacteria bacterium P01_F01_bin.150]
MAKQFLDIMQGSPEERIEALRSHLGYPLKQRDPSGSRFWYLRPGEDEEEAEFTCPVAVGFYAELDELQGVEAKQFLTSDEQQQEIHGHYLGRVIPDQPVIYLLLPEGERLGNVAMILPSESKLRQRQIQVFSWNQEDLQARLERLKQETLVRTNRIQENALSVIPLVEWAFDKPIETSRELAQRLAKVSRNIEQAIPSVYDAESNDGYWHNLLKSFQRELLPALKLEAKTKKDYSFADIYAQTIAYGLFTARVFSYTVDERKRLEDNAAKWKETDFNRHDAWQLLPETNPFLRRLFRDVSQQSIEILGDELGDAISEIFSILRAAKMDAILEDFRSKMNREDIVIRFYEDFLAAYKPEMRERRGVYYTPEPVVSYMVRSVDILLKEQFDKPLGLADPNVMILDPACGTGTFLLWIFQLIYQRFKENPEALMAGLEEQSWSSYVKDRLLPRIFGFELLMAPYAIAHLKLGLFLEETGYQFEEGMRLGIYLTNTLDKAIKKTETLFDEFIAKESTDAAIVKRDLKIKVVIGNPPYSISSANKGKYIDSLMKRYKKAVRHESNIQPLSDDYIKFIRFAHEKIQQTSHGIISFITNHSYISGISHRGMREEISNDFEQIFLLDLHGNISMREVCPDGGVDENVFDIRQGTSIAFWIKQLNEDIKKEMNIKHANLWGVREEKYKFLSNKNLTSTDFKDVRLTAPYFFFEPRDVGLKDEYDIGYELKKIFPVSSNGLETGKDEVFISFEKEVIKKCVQDISDPNITNIEIEDLYGIKSTSGWPFFSKRSSLIQEGFDNELVVSVAFRPFDNRYTYFHKILRRRQEKVLKHLMRENIGLLAMRQVVSGDPNYNHFGIIEDIADNRIFTSNRGRPSIFPLYIYSENELLEFKQANISKEFSDLLSGKLGFQPSPESILFYIYSIFHSPEYRKRYAEFLRIDFPRIPLTKNNYVFQKLSSYGRDLVSIHLMRSSKMEALITQFVDGDDRNVDPKYPKYKDGKVLINKKDSAFVGVPEEVWNFYIGGYQVCHKWLKDRKGRVLNDEDILHYQRIVVVIKETITLMQKIDEAIPSWPIE